MHVAESYSTLHYTSRLLGIAPFKIKKKNNKKIVCQSKFYANYTKIIYLIYIAFTCYRIKFATHDLYRLRNAWSIIFFILEFFVANILVLSTPIIFLKYSERLCNIQNLLNELFIFLTRERSKKLKESNKINKLFIFINILVAISLFLCKIFDFKNTWTFHYYLENILNATIEIPVWLMIRLPLFYYFALVNIIRYNYSSINKDIKFKLKEVEIKNIRNIEIILKDIFDDITSVFSFHVLVTILQAFLSCVCGIVLLITERENVVTLDFIVLIIHFIFCLTVSIKITSLVSSEVSIMSTN